MECYVCGKKPIRDNVSLVPIDPKGKNRRWSCLEHVPEGFKLPLGVKDICSIFDDKFEKISENIKFELGKCYQHSTGSQLKIVGEANTTLYGKCLVGETSFGELTPVGKTEDHAVNYIEISEEEWMKNFSK